MEENIMYKRKQVFLFAGLSVLVFILPLIRYIYPILYIAGLWQNILFFVLGTYFLIVFLTFKENETKTFVVKDNLTIVAIVLILIFSLISCCVNGKFEYTVYGNDFLSEGYLTQACYFIFALAAMQLNNKYYRKCLLHFIMLTFGFICFYGVMQYFEVPFMRYQEIKLWIFPITNRNFFASLAVMSSGLSIAGVLYKEKRNRIIWLVLATISFLACITARSLLAYAGLIMIFLLALFLILFDKEKKTKIIWWVILVVDLVVAYYLIGAVSTPEEINEFSPLVEQIKSEGSVFGDNVGTHRMKLWRCTFKLIPEYWLWGCGINNFSAVFEPVSEGYFSSDPHNEYLAIWIMQGIFTICSYLFFLFTLFIPGVLQFIKKNMYESDFVSKATLFAFFGYIAQAFFNIRVTEVAPYFYIVCGLLFVKRKYNDVEKNNNEIPEKNIEKI